MMNDTLTVDVGRSVTVATTDSLTVGTTGR